MCLFIAVLVKSAKVRLFEDDHLFCIRMKKFIIIMENKKYYLYFWKISRKSLSGSSLDHHVVESWGESALPEDRKVTWSSTFHVTF